MSGFNTIKKSRKRSHEIEEKLNVLNRELEKTKDIQEITMNTSDLYTPVATTPSTEFQGPLDVPNTAGVGEDGFTQNSAGSGEDGHASSFSSLSDLTNSSLNRPVFQSPNNIEGAAASYGVVKYTGTGAGDNYGIILDGNIVELILGGFIAGGTRAAQHYIDIYESYLAANQAAPGSYSDDQITSARIHAARATSVENIRNTAAEKGLEFNISWQGYRTPQFGESMDGRTTYVHPTRGTLVLSGFMLLGMAETYHIGGDRGGTTAGDPKGTGDADQYPPLPFGPEAFNKLNNLALFGFGRKPKPIYYGGQRGQDLRDLKNFLDDIDRRSPLSGGSGGVIKLSYVPKGNVLSENAYMALLLRDYRPNEQDYVKYGAKTPEERKTFDAKVKKVLAYAKKRPDRLEYVMKRYPKNDPRLSMLNYKMDNMMEASDEYIETQFPTNQDLFTKVKERTKKNMNLTDPKNFKPVKDPIKYVDVNKTKKLKETVTKHFNKPVKSKSMFGLNMGKVRKKNQKMIEKREQEQRVKEEEKAYIQEKMMNKKSNWRESFTNVTVGMKVGQTFVHNPSGQTVTTAGALGGVETISSTVSIFGDEIPGPDASQYGLQGYAKPMNIMKRKDPEDTNKKLDASQDFAKKVNADVLMNARVKSDGESTKASRTIKAAETLINYLTNKLPKGKWNDYLGKGYVDYAIRKGKLLSNGGVSVGDNVIGSAGSMTFDSQSGKYRINFKGLGVDDNITQFSKGEYSIFSKALYNLLGKFSADLMPNLPWLTPLSLAIAKRASDVLQVAKLFGGGKDVDAFVEFSPEELFSKNPQLAQDYMQQNFGLTGPVWSPRMMGSPQGSNPSVTHNYYALYGKLPPRSVVKGSVPMNFGDHPEYDPAVISKIDKMKKFLRSKNVRPTKDVRQGDKNKSVGFDRTIQAVRRKNKKN